MPAKKTGNRHQRNINKMDMDNWANPELEEENETPTAAPTEEKIDETDEGSQPEEIVEEKVPYHKDPRWIEMYEKAKRVDELEETINSLKSRQDEYETKNVEEKTEEIPPWFIGDEEQWKQYLVREETKFAQAKERWQSEQEQAKEDRKQEKAEEVNNLSNYFQNEIDILKEDFNFDEEKLKSYVIENEIMDSEGVFDLKRGLMKMMNQGTKANPARKDIASLTSSTPQGEQPIKDYATAEDFQGGNAPW